MSETVVPSPAQSWIDGFLAEEPPAALFHYTDENGVHGMFTTGEIWATNFRYLNDVSEFEHGKTIARAEIDLALAAEVDAGKQALLRTMREAVEAAGINIYVSSWSERHDDLSQWRAYGGSRTGYEIGMDGRELAAVAADDRFVLVRCLYREPEKRKKMQQLIQRVLWENEQPPDTSLAFDDPIPGGNLAYYLNRCACMFKDEAFESEREWRLISRPTSVRVPRAEIKPRGKSTLVAVYRMKASRGDPPAIRVKSICVGPCPHGPQANQAVASLLLKYNNRIGHDCVTNSRIPYRNW